MSSENIYSLAQEYEDKYNKVADLVQLIRQQKESRSKLSEVSQQMENLDYLLNQMDLEVSLLPKEDQAEITIHRTCRNHFNELRKKAMEVETATTKTKSAPVVDKESHSTDVSIMGDNSYEQGVQDLRAKYGVTGGGRSDAGLPEELLQYRKKKIMEKRVMIAGVAVGAVILIIIVLKLL
jgi:hypothetical protein